MNRIVNTAQHESAPRWLSQAGPGLVDPQRARGQQQLLESDALPTRLRAVDARVLRKLGFQFGRPYPHDPLFRPAVLPDAWRLRPTPHVLWSHIVDGDHSLRYQVFYDAAYFRRQAFILPARLPGQQTSSALHSRARRIPRTHRGGAGRTGTP